MMGTFTLIFTIFLLPLAVICEPSDVEMKTELENQKEIFENCDSASRLLDEDKCDHVLDATTCLGKLTTNSGVVKLYLKDVDALAEQVRDDCEGKYGKDFRKVSYVDARLPVVKNLLDTENCIKYFATAKLVISFERRNRYHTLYTNLLMDVVEEKIDSLNCTGIPAFEEPPNDKLYKECVLGNKMTMATNCDKQFKPAIECLLKETLEKGADPLTVVQGEIEIEKVKDVCQLQEFDVEQLRTDMILSRKCPAYRAMVESKNCEYGIYGVIGCVGSTGRKLKEQGFDRIQAICKRYDVKGMYKDIRISGLCPSYNQLIDNRDCTKIKQYVSAFGCIRSYRRFRLSRENLLDRGMQQLQGICPDFYARLSPERNRPQKNVCPAFETLVETKDCKYFQTALACIARYRVGKYRNLKALAAGFKKLEEICPAKYLKLKQMK